MLPQQRLFLPVFLLLFVATGRASAWTIDFPLGVKITLVLADLLHEWPMLAVVLGFVYWATERLLRLLPFRPSTRWLVRLTATFTLLTIMILGTCIGRLMSDWCWFDLGRDWGLTIGLLAFGYLMGVVMDHKFGA